MMRLDNWAVSWGGNEHGTKSPQAAMYESQKRYDSVGWKKILFGNFGLPRPPIYKEKLPKLPTL
jgi:hypothetical protein